MILYYFLLLFANFPHVLLQFRNLLWEKKKNNKQINKKAYFPAVMQWAAVTTQSAAIKDPPQLNDL